MWILKLMQGTEDFSQTVMNGILKDNPFGIAACEVTSNGVTFEKNKDMFVLLTQDNIDKLFKTSVDNPTLKRDSMDDQLNKLIRGQITAEQINAESYVRLSACFVLAHHWSVHMHDSYEDYRHTMDFFFKLLWTKTSILFLVEPPSRDGKVASAVFYDAYAPAPAGSVFRRVTSKQIKEWLLIQFHPQ